MGVKRESHQYIDDEDSDDENWCTHTCSMIVVILVQEIEEKKTICVWLETPERKHTFL